ncbi:DNA methyltransferase [Orientia tsutsugamushi]|nr:DNA methyltransferase [Orientia tsutsugamushi]SPP24788.1 DNA methyltransferase [Orientia tsutsugamushi]
MLISLSLFFIGLVVNEELLIKIEHLPQGPHYNYYEPFLGGGALFFQVRHLFKQCFLSDINLDLITSYNAVKNNPNEVNRLLSLYHKHHSKDYYYKVKNKYSNNSNEITAKFIYLNKYSFRGIYRVYKNGQSAQTFSGECYIKLHIASRINQCSNLLHGVSIYATDFSFIEPQQNDFVFFDPPYHKSGERFYTRLPGVICFQIIALPSLETYTKTSSSLILNHILYQ